MANKFFNTVIKYDTLFSILANLVTVTLFIIKVLENNKNFSDYVMLIWLILLSILFMVLLKGTSSIKRETSEIAIKIEEESRKNKLIDKYNDYALTYKTSSMARVWEGGSTHVYIFNLWKSFTEDELKELVNLGKISEEHMHEGHQYKDFPK